MWGEITIGLWISLSKKPIIWTSYVVSLNKLLNTQSSCCWVEGPWRPYHCFDTVSNLRLQLHSGGIISPNSSNWRTPFSSYFGRRPPTFPSFTCIIILPCAYSGGSQYVGMLEAQVRTVRSRYSAVPLWRGQFSSKVSEKTPIARPLGRVMGCIFCVQIPIYILTQSQVMCAITCTIGSRYKGTDCISRSLFPNKPTYDRSFTFRSCCSECNIVLYRDVSIVCIIQSLIKTNRLHNSFAD